MRYGKKRLVVALVCIGLAGFAYQSYQNDVLDRYRFEDAFWKTGFREGLDKHVPLFLSRDFRIVVDPPPSNSSSETRREIEYLRSLESERDDLTKAMIDYEANRRVSLIEAMNYDEIIPKELYGLAQVQEVIRQGYHWDLNFFMVREKMRFSRPRPSHLDPSLNLYIPNPGHASYPSGHAMQAYYVAFVLGELFPEHADALMKYAEQIAHRREIAGVHYPSDSEAGKIISRQIVDGLLQNIDFKALMDDAKYAIQYHRDYQEKTKAAGDADETPPTQPTRP